MTMDNFEKSNSSYMPQLDGLRALLVLGVMVSHWGIGGHEGFVPWGWLGVCGFLVLSGFLITGILIRMPKQATLFEKIKVFMIRRSLRIFPAYFVMLVVLWVLKEKCVQQYAPWCFTYTVNFLISTTGQFAGSVTHLWSLALEEQFYLVWPWFVLLLPNRRLRPLFIFAWLLGILARIFLVASGGNNANVGIFPLSALDFFAAGACLAWIKAFKPVLWERWCKWGWLTALPVLLCLGWEWMARNHTPVWRVMDASLIAIVFAWLIAVLARGVPGVIGNVLSSNPLAWLGRISYGLYLWHHFVPNGIGRLVGFWGAKESWLHLHWALQFGMSLGVTLVVAAGSFYLLERPFLRLKDKWGSMEKTKVHTPKGTV